MPCWKTCLVLSVILSTVLAGLAMRPEIDVDVVRLFYRGAHHFVGDSPAGMVARYIAWALPVRGACGAGHRSCAGPCRRCSASTWLIGARSRLSRRHDAVRARACRARDAEGALTPTPPVRCHIVRRRGPLQALLPLRWRLPARLLVSLRRDGAGHLGRWHRPVWHRHRGAPWRSRRHCSSPASPAAGAWRSARISSPTSPARC